MSNQLHFIFVDFEINLLGKNVEIVLPIWLYNKGHLFMTRILLDMATLILLLVCFQKFAGLTFLIIFPG